MKKCTKCQEVKSFSEFYKNKNNDDGFYYWCKKCSSEYQRSVRSQNREKFREQNLANYRRNRNKILAHKKLYEKTPTGRFSNYKSTAKHRGYCFDLTFEQFMSFWKLPCEYCGKEIPTIGLDRIDNSIGYVLENVIPCCEICNVMKQDLSRPQFLDQCSKITDRYSSLL